MTRWPTMFTTGAKDSFSLGLSQEVVQSGQPNRAIRSKLENAAPVLWAFLTIGRRVQPAR